ncbi:MAG TPA: oligosaccharide flippase family protein [Candidatus Thermoplasmatota archaeon]|nr:oligosaccharide flippase family protein [Candidatus Thermoplasmatota archaeon]
MRTRVVALLPRLRGLLMHGGTQYWASSVLASGAALLNNYAAALLLGPAIWGVWIGTRLLLTYGANLHLGTVDSMQRELPMLRDMGEEVRVRSTAFGIALSSAALAALLLFALTWVLPLDDNWRLCLRFLAPTLVLLQASAYAGAVHRARQRFDLVGRMSLAEALGHTVGVVLTLALGLHGFLAGVLLTYGAVAAYGLAVMADLAKPAFHRGAARRLVSVGLPILGFVVALQWMSTMDRVVVLGMFTEAELGLYALGAMAFVLPHTVFNAANSVVYALMCRRFGDDGQPRGLLADLLSSTARLAALVGAVVATIVIALPLAVRLLLPEYAGGVGAARVVVAGLFLVGLAGTSVNVLLALDLRRARNSALLLASAVGFPASILLARAGLGLEGVAGGAAAGYATYFAATSRGALRALDASGAEIRRFYASVLVPVGALAAVLLLALLPLRPWILAAAQVAAVVILAGPSTWRRLREVLDTAPQAIGTEPAAR